MKSALKEIFEYIEKSGIKFVVVTDDFLFDKKVYDSELLSEAKERELTVTRDAKHHSWLIHTREVGIEKDVER